MSAILWSAEVAPMRYAVTVVLVLGGACALIAGVKRVARSLRHADDPASALWLARGIRGIVVGVGAVILGVGLAFGSRGLLAFGAVFLAEELYETGVLVLILRRASCRP